MHHRTPLFCTVTSRPRRPGEVNNRDYQFVSRDELEEEASAGTLVEHGEYKGHLYGTSAVTLKSMINAGYVVVITPHYQVSVSAGWCQQVYRRLMLASVLLP